MSQESPNSRPVRGKYTVDINDGAKRLQIAPGGSLFSRLKEQGISLPTICGGRGLCGMCKLRVIEGGGPLTPTEQQLLKPQEIADRVRLGCRIEVRNDLAVIIPEELFLVREFRGVVEQIRDLTHDTKELRIRLIEPGEITFVPGQYVQLQAPPYGDNPEPVYRAYSISSPPSRTDKIELIIRLVPGGICTTWVFTMLEEGREVTFNGPYGEFRLSDADGEMIWVAGGSGMAPFWSMIRHMAENNIRRKCTYFFGAVQKRDLFLTAELKRMEQQLDWFTFVPALSAPAEGDDWSGQTGLITEAVDKHVPRGSQAEAYLCGSPGMIDAAARVLRAKGITEDRTFYDKFE